MKRENIPRDLDVTFNQLTRPTASTLPTHPSYLELMNFSFKSWLTACQGVRWNLATHEGVWPVAICIKGPTDSALDTRMVDFDLLT